MILIEKFKIVNFGGFDFSFCVGCVFFCDFVFPTLGSQAAMTATSTPAITPSVHLNTKIKN